MNKIEHLTREQILTEVDNAGFILMYRLSDETCAELDRLQAEGILATAREEGISFINEDYFYMRKGNPAGVHRVSDKRGMESWLEKEKV
jgi:hypothetical protein